MKKWLLACWLLFTVHSISVGLQPRPATTKKPATIAAPLKADGTPDMRYKVNKERKKGPLKKDGTPDKRYKANRAAGNKS